MVTLKHAFDANSMKGLVLKILRGTYPAIPNHYSSNLNRLISEMLIKDPERRPSIRKILDKEFVSGRISKLLSSTITKNDFPVSSLSKNGDENKKPDDEEKKENKDPLPAKSRAQRVLS